MGKLGSSEFVEGASALGFRGSRPRHVLYQNLVSASLRVCGLHCYLLEILRALKGIESRGAGGKPAAAQVAVEVADSKSMLKT